MCIFFPFDYSFHDVSHPFASFPPSQTYLLLGSSQPFGYTLIYLGTLSISPLCPLPLLPHSIDFSEHFLHVYTNYLCWNSVSLFIIFFLFFLWPLLLIPYILLLSSTINLCYSKLILNCLPPTILFDHLHTVLFVRKKTSKKLPTNYWLSFHSSRIGLKSSYQFFKGKQFLKKCYVFSECINLI